jgi:polyisoprenoid-binding protein YceI
MRRIDLMLLTFAIVTVSAVLSVPAAAQQGRGEAAPAGPPTAIRLEVMPGSRATYRVREQLAGVNFPNDAVGSTSDVTGAIVVKADGTIDSAQSKISVDLRTLKSDQDMRDGFLRGDRGLNTPKFPTADFVVKRAAGLTWPFPSGQPAQSGFQLIGDMTIYGNTSELTWNVVATYNPKQVSGRATTSFTFAKFGIPKPQLARLLSVDDTINLELEVRFSRQALQ